MGGRGKSSGRRRTARSKRARPAAARARPPGAKALEPSRRLISSASVFEEKAAYSRAVVDGGWVFISGTTGFDYRTGTIAEDAAEQAEQALRNIEWALAEAGARLADIVRLRVFLADAGLFEPVASVLGRRFRAIRPANTTVIAPLIDPRMKVEIEATARMKRTRRKR